MKLGKSKIDKRNNRIKRNILGMICLLTLANCGGGGGGSSSKFYGGVWDFVARKIVDSCQTNASSNFNAVVTVNQDGDNVVANSGTITLSGKTNDKDGFDVTGTSTTSQGCAAAYGYRFIDASDGIADAILAILVRCGSAQCDLGYGGSASKRSNKESILLSSSTLNQSAEELAQSCISGTINSKSIGESSILEDTTSLLESLL